MQTRWNHLSDRELLNYKDLIDFREDPTIVEELFNRLDKKIDFERESAAAIDAANTVLFDKETDDIMQMEGLEEGPYGA